jgi:hypothetical protein
MRVCNLAWLPCLRSSLTKARDTSEYLISRFGPAGHPQLDSRAAVARPSTGPEQTDIGFDTWSEKNRSDAERKKWLTATATGREGGLILLDDGGR